MSIEIESAEFVVFIIIFFNLFNKIFSLSNKLNFAYSVIRLIQQYLKESNLMKSLQTLQVIILTIPLLKTSTYFCDKKIEYTNSLIFLDWVD